MSSPETTARNTPELTVLDVGHGNCTLVRDGETVFVVDEPKQDNELRAALRTHRIKMIDAVLVSHGDKDHVGGVSALIADEDLDVKRLYVNSDPIRDTIAWTAVRLAVRDAHHRGSDLVVTPALTTTTTAELRMPRLAVDVLAPTPHLAMSGPGGRSESGRKLTSNSMSAVVRFRDSRRPGHGGVLLAGDLDDVGFEEMTASGADAEAEVLVFPHHGGRPGNGNPRPFAERFMATVKPDRVVISHQRGGNVKTPHPEVMAGIRSDATDTKIACTQLSPECAGSCPTESKPFLSSMPARGEGEPCSRCAGTMDFRFGGDGLHCDQLAGHERWVNDHVDTPMCMAAPVPEAAAAP